jgi:hypothetical protein
MSAMNIYYVYAYLRASDNTPYYIGKGKNNRAFSNQHSISVPKDKTKIVFLEKNLTNIGACALERRYIRWYGRKNDNSGILHNITEGGDGNSAPRSDKWKQNHSEMMTGRKMPEEVKIKLSQMDKSYMKTEEYRKKMSMSKKGKPNLLLRGKNRQHNSIRVKTPLGIFCSLREASKKHNISVPTVKVWATNQINGFSIL